MNYTEYIACKRLIYAAFNINQSIPKGYGVNSSDYNIFYSRKRKFIESAVNKIIKFSLPIKYGVDNPKYPNIIYFAFDGKQFSFHGVYYHNNFPVKKYKSCWRKGNQPVTFHKRPTIRKKYNGNWIGTRRKYFIYNEKRKIIFKKLTLH